MNAAELYESLGTNEGYSAVPYLDTKALWTIGKGTCLETNPISAKQWKFLLDHRLITLTLKTEGADYLIQEKVAECVQVLSRRVKNWPSLSDARQNILIECCYQMGTGFIDKFPQMIKQIEAGNWNEAANEGIDSKWYRVDSPKRAKKLMDAFREDRFP